MKKANTNPSPQGYVDSNLIVAKVVNSNEGKGGARVRGPINPI
jgi:hypothetical protein